MSVISRISETQLRATQEKAELRKRWRSDREGGQALVLFVLALAVLLGFVALTIDVGLAYVERRELQNAVDAAALAAAHDFTNGQSEATAAATAIDYLQRHGFSAPEDTIEVNIPPTSGQYSGLSGYVEVKASSEAPPAFLLLFLDEPYTLSARAVAEGKAGGVLLGTGSGPGDGGGGDTSPPLPPANVPTVSCGGPTVDGRVTDDEGYTKIGDLLGGPTDYGDVFFGCDADYNYFAVRLDGPSTTGVAANENVYACKPGKAGDVQINGSKIKKLKGAIVWVGVSSFTMDANGEIWTVNVDGNTTIELDKQPATIDDLAPGQEADVKGGVVGPNHALASSVKAKSVAGGCGGLFSPTYHADYDTGWVQSPKGKHTFKDLLGSDRARFQIACDGVVRHDFIQDYLTDDGGGSWRSAAAGDGEIIVAGPNDSASSLEWNLENPALTGWGDDPGEDPLVQSPPFNPSYPMYDSEYDGWIWEMIYEFRVPASAYGDCVGPVQLGLHDFSGSVGPLEGIHSSPAKTDEGVWLQIQARVLKLVE